ncbi:uncharacterized protein LACBIDRAFT_334355 [Laccaria bicolor S238N-H82]|uniref:Predicted protein n=1 Tax=Laccaria bicolor (strain S238N-H82 / ATCC MYA-4686) TaxID=486041 RepID=B0DYY5_LACBS|nr:uncharacterized protein LACBIDRAFT_334355 [Laccaria bicolor S238N-H82]EDR00226.1 predicted protein [Laccaria bicolor S238N-H82]|eukprot:XP_001889135.1 predicted protein [Laccaria bicolor S238N-H82]
MDNREPRTTETETQSTTASTFCCTKLQLSNTLYASCIAMHTFLAILVDTGHSRRCKTQAKLGWVQRSSTIIRCTCYTLSEYAPPFHAPVGFLGGTLWVSSAVVVSCHFRAYVSGCRSRTASQKLHSYTRSSTPPTINTPSEPPLITPERPNPLRPLLTNIAFCQLFAVCLSGNYKDPKYRLLHSFG